MVDIKHISFVFDLNYKIIYLIRFDWIVLLVVEFYWSQLNPIHLTLKLNGCNLLLSFSRIKRIICTILKRNTQT